MKIIRIAIEAAFADEPYVEFADLPGEWDGMDDEEKGRHLAQLAADAMSEQVTVIAHVVDGAKYEES